MHCKPDPKKILQTTLHNFLTLRTHKKFRVVCEEFTDVMQERPIFIFRVEHLTH